MGWLHATPEKQKRTRMEELMSRVDEIEMPETNGYSYLIDWVTDIGLTQNSGMGETPLTVSEIKAWGEDIDITHFEVMTMRNLSVAYLSSKSKSEKPICARPFIPESEKSNIDDKIEQGLFNNKFNENKIND